MRHKQADSIGVFLTLGGRDFDPEECTRVVGLLPAKVWAQRYEHLRGRVDLDNVNWSVGFEEKEYDGISDAVDEVLERVWPYRDKLVTYAEQHGLRITVNCNVRIYAEAPEYSLSASTVQRLAELKAGVLMDIFDYREDGPVDELDGPPAAQ